MKLIKVYLQYPWKFPDSPYYKYLVENPPKGVEYLNAERQKGVITSKRFFWFSNILKENIRSTLNLLKVSKPNIHLSPKQDYNLIHCAHCLSKNNDKPWVADIESDWQLYVGNKTRKSQEKVRKILLNKNCKKVLPWTSATSDIILGEFPEIKNKVEVIYPAVPVQNNRKKKHAGINLLFIARYFYNKGGLEALEVMDKLTKKYVNVRGIFVSEVPREIYNKYSKNKKIKFYGLMSQKRLFEEIYPISDIFIYPGYTDTFGFAYLEAMSFGIPTITFDGFAREEIIRESVTGFIIKGYGIDISKTIPRVNKKEDVCEDIVKKTEQLIIDHKLRKKMSINCINEIKKGKFSIEERNRKLKRIYEESLK